MCVTARYKSIHTSILPGAKASAKGLFQLWLHTRTTRTDTRLVMRLLVIANHEMARSGTIFKRLYRLPKCVYVHYMTIGTHCDPWPEPAELRIARMRLCHSVCQSSCQSVPELNAFKTKFLTVSLCKACWPEKNDMVERL